MLANTVAHNIPVSLGIYPRSEEYKGLNGERDTNNETFHFSPEPRQSETRIQTTLQRGVERTIGDRDGVGLVGVYYRFQDFCDGEDLRDCIGSNGVTEDVGVQVAEVGESSAGDWEGPVQAEAVLGLENEKNILRGCSEKFSL